MGYRLGCSHCNAYTSAIFRAYGDGLPCPYCGGSLASPENAKHFSEQLPKPTPPEPTSDNDELAMRLKHGYEQTIRDSDNGENAPGSDPEFWQKYALWWAKNGVWDDLT